MSTDNHTTPLSQINPAQLDTGQWCHAAKLWGGKEILFVAKHTGGFCWWQTETTKYGIKETPWKDGKGDVLAELSASCREQGLHLGIYISPVDDVWGAPGGSGGRTKDPSKQEAYNRVFRQQLTEVLTRYGPIIEVWFDGSCVINVSDLLKQHASNAVIFQGPQATIRWAGTESGKLPYPAWNSLKSEDLRTGVATAAQGDPDGDAWAPLEADTTLYNHNWFWAAENEKKRKNLNELLDIYYQSAGRGGVLLLNSSPNTNGLVPADDLKLYEAFGQEIERRFSRPIAEIKAQRGGCVELSLPRPATIDHVVLMEDYREGERIREYNLEGFRDGEWKQLHEGTSVGRQKIDRFPPTQVSRVRVRVTRFAAEPIIRRLAAFQVEGASTSDRALMIHSSLAQSALPLTSGGVHAATLTLTAPLEYQVIQRETRDRGRMVVQGQLADQETGARAFEARIAIGGRAGKWSRLSTTITGQQFSATMEVPAGGWHHLEVRVLSGDKVLAEAAVEHVGVGEVFVVAGQSNAANHGEEKQTTASGKVVTFDGQHWRLGNDPQPGASGTGGSFLPPFGDAIVQRFGVPVGFVACGIGATSVREWLPKGTRFPNPPTLTGRVRQLADGQWESKGEAFDLLVARMKQLGPRGFRAVLWHQGESDANQQDPARTLPGSLYHEYLEELIRESRRALGWEVPWFVAQVSYHVPGDEASADIRAAQASLWKDGIALPGPDSDALKGDLRENGGKGVHFSGPGLRAHAASWMEKVAPWLERTLRPTPMPAAQGGP